MNQISSVMLLTLALAFTTTFTFPRAEALVNCYVCNGTLTSEEGRRCADNSNTGLTTVMVDYCFIRTSISSISSNLPVITRGGSFEANAVHVPQCTPSLLELGAQCTCTTERCNDAKVKIPYLTCFECSTMGMLSGACGEGSEFNGGSIYVKQTPGCHACVKHESHDGAITRRCSRNLYSTSRCDDEDKGRTCYCTDSLCNTSAHTQASILASVVLVSLTRWLL